MYGGYSGFGGGYGNGYSMSTPIMGGSMMPGTSYGMANAQVLPSSGFSYAPQPAMAAPMMDPYSMMPSMGTYGTSMPMGGMGGMDMGGMAMGGGSYPMYGGGMAQPIMPSMTPMYYGKKKNKTFIIAKDAKSPVDHWRNVDYVGVKKSNVGVHDKKYRL